MKKTTEIATNTSSGAEKVEKIEKEVKTENKNGGKTQQMKTATRTTKTPATEKGSAKGDAALGDSVKTANQKTATQKTERISAKKINTQSSSGAAEAESLAAKARVEAALKRKELQEKKKAERVEKRAAKAAARAKKRADRKASIEKRLAERKALIEKRAAQRKAEAEKRAAEKQAQQQERAHAKANKHQAQSKKKTQRSQRKNARKEGGERERKGYGGWLAAVVSLGAVTLALTTAVTVGAVEMKKTKDSVLMGYKGTMYELTGIMERMDDDLDRARISASPSYQSRILTDLLVDSRLAELDLEKMPIEAEADRNVTAFINHTARECERMLEKLRRGEKLSEEDTAILERLYQANHQIRQELDGLIATLTDKDLMQYIKDGTGMIGDTMGRLEEFVTEEGRALKDRIKDKMTVAGMSPDKKMPSKDGENKEGKTEQAGIDPARAEELCGRYFSDYKITEFQCVGETVGRGYKAYNVQGYDENGTLLFAEVDQTNGVLLRFDYYEECAVDNFDLQNAEMLAEQFLEKLGYDDMEVVRFRDNGTTTDFTFVYEDDDVAYYPDEVHIKVCRTRGLVTGMDATKFVLNHKDRGEPNVKITMSEAYEKLRDGLTVESARLAVLKMGKKESAAYEFVCSYGEEKYFVYISAETGEEISIVNARAVS